MYRLLSRNTPLAYAALLILLVALRGRTLYDPARFVVADSPDLFPPLWLTLTQHIAPASTLAVILAIATTYLTALIINNIANRFGLAPERSALAGFFFIVLSGAFRLSLALQPIYLFALALVWAMDRLFSATNKDKPQASIAWAFAIVSIGSLVWPKGLTFIPLLLVFISLLRIGGPRSYAAALVGIVATLFVSFTLLTLSPTPMESIHAYIRSALATQPYWRLGPVSITYLTIELGIIVMALLNTQRRLLELSISTSRKIRSAEWLFFFSLLLILLPGFSCETQILVAIGPALILPRYIQGIRSARVREAIPIVMTAATAYLIYA